MKAIVCADTGELCNDYREYLQSRHWKKFKYKYKQTHKNICLYCLKERKYLDIHHLSYENLGREQEQDCIFLCYHCHSLLHKALDNKEINRSLKILKNFCD